MAALAWGFAPIVEKLGLQGKADPVIGVFIRSLGVMLGALFFLPVLPRMTAKFSELGARNWLFLLAGGILASIVGQLCFYRALKSGDVSRVVPIGAAYPVIACMLGIVLFKEPLTYSKVAGIALVVAGTLMLR
jgi:bacterial/archaeal transporter family protein